MDMESAKSDVNGPKKKVYVWHILLNSEKNTKKITLKTWRPKLYWIRLEFQQIGEEKKLPQSPILI